MLRACAPVDLGAIERNSARLKAEIGGAVRLCAVVKADGYGHGAVEAAGAAIAGGATWLATATADEAAGLRAAGIGARLLVMGALSSEELEVALDADADIVAWDEGWAAALARRGRHPAARVHVKLDTGMGRLGTPDPAVADRICGLAKLEPGLELVGAMTHFATADERGDDYFGVQLERFTRWVAGAKRAHPQLVVHAANSAAVLRDRAAHFDMVRAGIAIYGLDPFQRDASAVGLEPALSLRSYVADLKHLEPGASVGYGRRFIATDPTAVGVLPIGYGDGLRRGLSNNADVLIADRRCALVGTVSMDNVTVEAGWPPMFARGDEAVLIGRQGDEQITAEELASRLGTINYEITCGLTSRVPRAYHRGKASGRGADG